MAFGGGKKGQQPKKSKPAKSYTVRPAVPPVSGGGGGRKSSGSATRSVTVAAVLLLAVPAALALLALGYIVWGTVS